MKRYETPEHVLLTTFKACIAVLWTATAATAYAAVASGDHSHPIGLDLMLVALSCIVSTLSGTTSLAWRINNLMLAEDERVATEGGERRPFVRPVLFAVSHMGGSWLGGILAFLIATGADWAVWNLLGFVLCLSFVGSTGVEKVAEKWLSVIQLPTGGAGLGAPRKPATKEE